ncbi:MAG: hypothetical protein RDU83_09655 [bacterium]|nr:hypothetical protein [bacterium]
MKARLAALLSERTRLLLLSLAIATAMWHYVGSAQGPRPEPAMVASLVVRNVEVTFTELPPDLVATAQPRTVDLEIRGPTPAVLSVKPSDVRAIAPVGAMDPGMYRVTINVPVPPGVTLAQASPPVVMVTIARP